METKPVPVEAVQIEGADNLDRIHVFWMNIEPGKGYVTIICYGCAWTAYFGAMGGRTIQQFVAEVDTDYLVVKMGNNPTLKSGERHKAYLARIIGAVQTSLRTAE